jgi:hypothetical protein
MFLDTAQIDASNRISSRVHQNLIYFLASNYKWYQLKSIQIHKHIVHVVAFIYLLIREGLHLSEWPRTNNSILLTNEKFK